MRVVALNLQAGGSRRAGVISAALAALEADVVVLGEAYPTGHSQVALDALRVAGFGYQATASSDSPTVASAVALASRKPLSEVSQPLTGPNRHRLLEVTVDGLTVTGAYFPLKAPKVAFWRNEFLPYARSRLGDAVLLMGDWNSGSHLIDEAGATLHGATEFGQMTTMGWIDAWRTLHPNDREFTWFSTAANGFRLDHGFLSPSLAPKLKSAKYDHAFRELRVSDHSALVIDLAE